MTSESKRHTLTRRSVVTGLAGAIAGNWAGKAFASDGEVIMSNNTSSLSLRLLKSIHFKAERSNSGTITSLAWNPGGTLIAVAFDWGRKISILEAGNWKVISTFSRTATRNRISMGFCSNSELVTLPNDERLDSALALAVYDAHEGRVVAQISRPPMMRDVAQSIVVTGDCQFAVLNTYIERQLVGLYFDLQKKHFVDVVPTLPGASTTLIATGPGSRMALNAVGRGLGPDRIKPIILVDLSSKKIDLKLAGQAPGIASMAWSPDGRYFASGASAEQPHDPHPIRIWDVITGRETNAISGAYCPISSIAWHPTSVMFAAKGAKGTGALGSAVRFWSAIDGRLIFEYLAPGQSVVSEVSFHPLTGQLLWAADNALHVFDVLEFGKPTSLTLGRRSQ